MSNPGSRRLAGLFIKTDTFPGGAPAGPAWKRPGIVRGSCGLATRCAQGSEARGLIGSRAKTPAAHEHSRHKCTTMTLYCWGPGDPFTRTPTMTHNNDPNRWWTRRVLALGIERSKILKRFFLFEPVFFVQPLIGQPAQDNGSAFHFLRRNNINTHNTSYNT